MPPTPPDQVAGLPPAWTPPSVVDLSPAPRPSLFEPPTPVAAPAVAPAASGPWNPAAAWVIDVTNPLRPPIAARRRPTAAATPDARDGDQRGGRRAMAGVAIAGLLATGGAHILLQSQAQLDSHDALPPNTVRPAPDTERQVVHAEVTLASLDRELDAVQRTEAQFAASSPAGVAESGSVRALQARKAVLQQQRAVVQAQLAALRDQPAAGAVVAAPLPAPAVTPGSAAPVGIPPFANAPVANAPFANSPGRTAPVVAAPAPTAPLATAPGSAVPVTNASGMSAPGANTPLVNVPLGAGPFATAPGVGAADVTDAAAGAAPLVGAPGTSRPDVNRPPLGRGPGYPVDLRVEPPASPVPGPVDRTAPVISDAQRLIEVPVSPPGSPFAPAQPRPSLDGSERPPVEVAPAPPTLADALAPRSSVLVPAIAPRTEPPDRSSDATSGPDALPGPAAQPRDPFFPNGLDAGRAPERDAPTRPVGKAERLRDAAAAPQPAATPNDGDDARERPRGKAERLRERLPEGTDAPRPDDQERPSDEGDRGDQDRGDQDRGDQDRNERDADRSEQDRGERGDAERGDADPDAARPTDTDDEPRGRHALVPDREPDSGTAGQPPSGGRGADAGSSTSDPNETPDGPGTGVSGTGDTGARSTSDPARGSDGSGVTGGSGDAAGPRESERGADTRQPDNRRGSIGSTDARGADAAGS
ncbi:MAG TPA: hypothetical protein VNO83_09470, partial [Pseudonocardia sp.]|nr:hypothetical protein [Pseudonocardia sp.]